MAVTHLHSIVLTNSLSEIERLSQFVDRVTGERNLTADDNANLNLLLDEIVSNVIRHGFDDAGAHKILVSLAITGGMATIEVNDDGRAFNPLEAPPPNFEAPIEERIGGLGIHIVRSIAQSIDYRRSNGHNVLTVVTKLGS
jgi:anti-sigma regulatory factor (Ser/Thr protein kinase)